MKLLAVENEPRIASFPATGLRAHDYDAPRASTGQQALRLGTNQGSRGCSYLISQRSSSPSQAG